MAENQFGRSAAGYGPVMAEPSNIETSFVVYAGRLKPVPLIDVPIGKIRAGQGNPIVWEFREGVRRVAEYHGD